MDTYVGKRVLVTSGEAVTEAVAVETKETVTETETVETKEVVTETEAAVHSSSDMDIDGTPEAVIALPVVLGEEGVVDGDVKQ